MTTIVNLQSPVVIMDLWISPCNSITLDLEVFLVGSINKFMMIIFLEFAALISSMKSIPYYKIILFK